MNLLTIEDVKKKFPGRKRAITQDLVDEINDMRNNEDWHPGAFMDKMIDHQSVMTDNTGLKSYMKAIKYLGYLEMEMTSTDSYIKTFPEQSEGKDRKFLETRASQYKKTKLVQRLIAQADMPLHLFFQGYRFKAAAKLAYLMENGGSDRIQMESADKLLGHIKPPDNLKVELDLGVQKSTAVEDLQASLAMAAAGQLAALKDNKTTIDVLGSLAPTGDIEDAELIDGEQ